MVYIYTSTGMYITYLFYILEIISYFPMRNEKKIKMKKNNIL